MSISPIKSGLLSILLSSGASSTEIQDEAALLFTKNTLSKMEEKSKGKVSFSDISIKEIIAVKDIRGLKGYIVEFSLSEKDSLDISSSKRMTDSFFVSKEGLIATELYNKEGESLLKEIVPQISEDYYSKDNFFLGDHKSKKKILLFSDPFCPICRDLIKDIISKEGKDFALYLYEYPLAELHPGSEILIPMMHQAKRKGTDITKKVYTDDRILSLVSELDEEVHKEKIKEYWDVDISIKDSLNEDKNHSSMEYKKGRHLNISGTPSIFMDGKKSSMKEILEVINKENKTR